MFFINGTSQPNLLVQEVGTVFLVGTNLEPYIWAIYNDLSRGHPKWWFSKGIPPKVALN